MKLCRLYIQDFQQFRDFELDFTHPKTGEPLEKICFIGSNGTGKSTLLRLIQQAIELIEINKAGTRFSSGKAYWFEFALTKGRHFIVSLPQSPSLVIVVEREQADALLHFYGENRKGDQFNNLHKANHILDQAIVTSQQLFSKFPINQLITSPAEVINNTLLQVTDVPQTTLNSALDAGRNSDKTVIVSAETAVNFWNQLIYHSRERGRQRDEFENLPENLDKTKRQLTDEFDRANPKILDNLATLWNKILDKTGLHFSVDNVRFPIQLTDNLLAYITLKSTGQTIAYNQLSTGIRNFIFRIGHIYSLYFNRKIENGFLLVDEPENSLFPDFLLDLIRIYQQATTDQTGQQNTQLFFATHNPIIAAQFEPFERVILDWNDTGHVSARRGTAPLGDDPNDLLVKDFDISSLVPEAGIAVWEHYLALKKQLRHTSNPVQEEPLISEISRIGYDHNFPQ